MLKEEPGFKFPLRISANGRYFEDQNGKPFLIQGDTAWSLIAQLNLEDAEYYLDKRKSQGFNAILVNLIEHKFADNPPKNAEGDEPFKKPGDFSSPNEKYFKHADTIISMAAQKVMLVFLVPAYLGWNWGDEGWYQEIIRCGPEKLQKYGLYLGARYKNCTNIVWVMGGDYTPSWFHRWTVNELAEGIREAGATQLMTAHCGQESPAEAFAKEKWLDFTNVYTYSEDLSTELQKEYARRPLRPFIMIESIYEGEHNASPELIRSQGYCSLLNGAAGYFYGNNPVWNFDSPVKVFPSKISWKEALNSRGAHDMSHLWNLFKSLEWNDLIPDITYQYGVQSNDKNGSEHDPLVAATKNSNIIIIYISSNTKSRLSFDFHRIKSSFDSFWYDPITGEMINSLPLDFIRKSKIEIEIPEKKFSNHSDWTFVLVKKQ